MKVVVAGVHGKIAMLLRRSHDVRIDDVYERPGFPVRLGALRSPRFPPGRPATVGELELRIEHEHRRVDRFYREKDEALLGHAQIYDPAIGWLNYVQALRVVVYHDAHHHRIVLGRIGRKL